MKEYIILGSLIAIAVACLALAVVDIVKLEKERRTK